MPQRLNECSPVNPTAALAHDVRNCTASLVTLTSRLLDHQDGDVRTLAARLLSAMDRLTDICRQAERAAGQPDRSDRLELGEFLREAAELATAACSGAVEVEIRLADRPVLELSPAPLFRMFNLLHNALKAVQRSGGSCVAIEAALSDERLALDIIDDGPGLPPAIIELLHTSGQSAHAEGLGLPTALSIARDLGWSIALVSSGPCGTTIRVTAPCCAPQATRAGRALAHAAPYRHPAWF